jgi:hypothetical protein
LLLLGICESFCCYCLGYAKGLLSAWNVFCFFIIRHIWSLKRLMLQRHLSISSHYNLAVFFLLNCKTNRKTQVLVWSQYILNLCVYWNDHLIRSQCPTVETIYFILGPN